MTAPTPLTPAALSRPVGKSGPRSVRLPSYDRTAVRAGIVHLGLGAFARAHLARYCDDLLTLGDGAAAITGAAVRSAATVRALAGQDGLYTLIESDAEGADLRVIGSVTGLATGAEATIGAVADQAVTTVTLTITEKGYHHNLVTGRLDGTHPAVRHDAAHADAPVTAPGVLVAALRRRRDAGHGGLAVVSCDNLPGNGRVTAAVVTELAARTDPDLAAWIAEEIAFPSTVVDRIVPATTDADRRLVASHLGLHDAAPVRAERHCAWVVEKAAGLPGWDRVGATVVDDVTPWQELKLRLVNGPHSALAYLGALAGHATIDAAVADPALAGFVRTLAVDEIVPTLPPAVAGQADATAATTLVRFANPTLGHRTRQVAADGSHKLRQRILGPVADRLQAGAPVDRLALVVAAWMAWVARCTGGPDRLDDPLAPRLSAAVRAAPPGPAGLAGSLLATTEVFDPPLAADTTFRAAVVRGLTFLDARGAAGAAEAMAARTHQ